MKAVVGVLHERDSRLDNIPFQYLVKRALGRLVRIVNENVQ